MFCMLAIGKITSWTAIGAAVVSTWLTSDIIMQKYNKQVKIIASGTAIGTIVLCIIGIILL